jgi:3-oxoacyl-[acyl-carrier-protein] synthase II
VSAHDPAERVVVTGLGCVTPIGVGLGSTWDAAIEGQSGGGEITHFDTTDYPVRIAAEVKDPVELPEVSDKEARRLERGVRFALYAATEALTDAGSPVGDENRDRVGVAIGSGISGLGTLLENYRQLLKRGPRRVSPFTIPMGIPNMPSGYVSVHHKLRGPNLCHVSACASGSHSIGEASRLLVRGEADIMLAGGTEAPILDLAVSGFAAMKALSTRNDEPKTASRPFDRERDGFLVGEGAGVLVLETLAHARARGARIRGEILGYGASADGSHIAAPEENGDGARRCMQAALEDAGLAPEQIDHVNAHATSTPAGDPIEVRALRSVLGPRADEVPVSATKSMTGHLLGAAGAIEAIFCLMAMETGMLPPTINLANPDPECELNHVANEARALRARACLSNSFGFGGTNASLILGAAED